MPHVPAWAFVLLLGVLLIAAGLAAIRASGARVSLARRLAGARQLRVGDALDADPLPARPVRLLGRVRCPDPIVTDRDERLVALHRDVEVRTPDGRWRVIERVRETRGFELWDHDGSLTLDPAHAAEPLVAIPHVWRGTTAELSHPPYADAIARLAPDGRELPARSVTRMVATVDRLQVLAEVRPGPDGRRRLEPPPGGYVISVLELPDAMRLLGGPRRGLLLAGAGLLGAGVVVAAISLGVALISAVA
ncbi:MAG TPA: hypothetical protein VFH63_04410 [candidate division Zixibacteria bacterium]|nr:hypothetical protein [candidate division Zixibacteria bacterium]